MNTLVLGGGITGRMFQWFHPDAVILERNPKEKADRLTREFGANYLWEPIPELTCKPVKVVTHVDGEPGTPASIMRYKHKIGKPEDEGNWGLQFDLETFGYLATQYPESRVEYDCEVVRVDLRNKTVLLSEAPQGFAHYDVLVNTLPLPTFCKLAGLDGQYPVDTMCRYQPIYVRVAPRPPDAPYPPEMIYVNYLSDPTIECYRYCDRDNERHYEGLSQMGTLPTRKLFPGKIWRSPDVDRVLNNLQDAGVLTFGRYGSWSPDELLHETYRNIRHAAALLAN